MARVLSEVDSRLLNVLQSAVPLVERPFAALGESVGLSEEEVLARLAELKGPPRPVIRQISAIFDSKSLGYQSTLVAARIEESHLEEAAARINEHPGVSHNYRRNHAYNLWYTLAVPPDSRLGLEKTLEILHRASGAQATRMLPTLQLFKIGVKLDLTGEGEESGGPAVNTSAKDKMPPAYSEAERAVAAQYAITAADKKAIRVLQQDLPLVPRPFDIWAQQAQMGVPELLALAQQYAERRLMRRFSAVLKHREVGFSANGMGVWVVPPEKQQEFGRIAAGFSAVSHCYLRPTYEDWPYSMFTMVHAPSEEACRGVLAAISEATGVKEYSSLFSSKEYKKVRVKYFVGDIEAWEAAHLA